MDSLLPCPLCGERAELFHDDGTNAYWVWCVACLAATGSVATAAAAIASWNHRPETKRLLLDFYNRVCDRAEKNIEATGTVSGARWNAMRQELAVMGIGVAR